MTQRIIELARTMGAVSGEETAALTACAQAAERELTCALRPEVSVQQCADMFALAGAWLALAGLEVSRSAGAEDSFSAGDLTVHGGNGTRRAEQLRAKAWELMSEWVKDRGFAFYGVRG